MQTLWASKARRAIPITTFAERIELDDGDFLDLNWSWERDQQHQPTAITCVFHGLAGSIQSSYATGIIGKLQRLGMDSVFMHFRGCSGEPNRLASSYHSGHTDDIRHLIATLAEKYPQTPLHAIGYSLGANALLCYLGEEGDTCPLTSAIAISPPLVLEEGAKRLNHGFSRIYQRYLLAQMSKQLEQKRRRYPELDLPEVTGKLDTFWKFDDTITAPLAGFKDVHDYYAKCGSRQFLPDITVRTHIINALDDPFFSKAIVPGEDELSPSVTLELSEQGGHVGFVSGDLPWKANYWLDERIAELLTTELHTA